MSEKPVYRVGAAGLDPRDWRLIEIVFRHSQYNRFEFRLVARIDSEAVDLLIANPADPDGVEALACIGETSRRIPFVEAVPRGASASSPYALAIDRLTLQLLPVLNRVVELELQDGAAAASEAAASTDAAAAPETVADGGTHAGAGSAPLPELAAAPWTPGRLEGSVAAPSLQSGDPLAQHASLPLRGEAPAPAAPVVPSQAATEEPAHPARDAAARAGIQASRPALPTGTASAAPSLLPAGARPPGRLAEQPSQPPGQLSRVPDQTTSDNAARPPAGISQVPRQPEQRPLGPDTDAAAAARSNLVAFPRQGASERGAPPRLRVLVVDDSPTVRRQLGLAFERLGLECDAASSAAEALRMLDDGHFDLILVDVVMPDMDGYRLTREIKRNRRLRGLPVIILTSRSSPFDLARGALAGCDTYLTKPVPFRALEKAVVRQLRRSLAIDDLGGLVRSAAEPRAPEPSAPTGSQPLARVARLFGR